MNNIPDSWLNHILLDLLFNQSGQGSAGLSRAVYNRRNPRTSYPQRNQLKLGNPMLEDEAFEEGP